MNGLVLSHLLCLLVLGVLLMSTHGFVRTFGLHRNGPLRPLGTVASQGKFEDFLDSMTLPVLVDFYAEWCGPCKQMKPVLAEVATRLDTVAKVAKVDTDKAPKLSAKYGIHALPTLILFNKGEIVERFEGYRSADEVENLVRRAISRLAK